jgi:hypothetical protein
MFLFLNLSGPENHHVDLAQGHSCRYPASAPVRQNYRSRQGAKMRQKSDPTLVAAEKLVRDIRRATRSNIQPKNRIGQHSI